MIVTSVKSHDRVQSMEPSPLQTTLPLEEDEWDTDGFVIPSLAIEDHEQVKSDSHAVQDSESTVKDFKEEHIYLGPHGAPPSHTKLEQGSSTRKNRFKQKLKEADKKFSGTERENKVENLRELVGGAKMPVKLSEGSPKGWLDPHCHESQFEKKLT